MDFNIKKQNTLTNMNERSLYQMSVNLDLDNKASYFFVLYVLKNLLMERHSFESRFFIRNIPI